MGYRLCRKHSIKVLARLPPPCHIPSLDTSWFCSPAATPALYSFEFTSYAYSFHTDERNHKLLEWNTDSSEIRFCSEGWEVSENFIIHEEFIWNLPLPWQIANSPVHAEEGLTWILAVPISVLPVGSWKCNSNWELKITYSTCTARLADKSTDDSGNMWHPSVLWKREQLLSIVL